MKILLTGGAGFIGSHLLDRLVIDHEVVVVDNFITGSPANLGDTSRFELFIGDIKDFISVTDFDFVYHLAGIASPKYYRKYPIESLLVGSAGLNNVLENISFDRILIASTSEVYGDPKESPQKESYWGHVNCIGERSMYDESKRFSEALVMAYGLDSAIARIFNTYGSRMQADDGRAIPQFINQALKGEDITIYGDGSFTRSFCYIDDMVRGLIALMDSGIRYPVNLGNPTERTILSLAHSIKELTKSSSKIIHLPEQTDDPKRRNPNITKAKKELDWSPEVEFVDGLRKTIHYFESLF